MKESTALDYLVRNQTFIILFIGMIVSALVYIIITKPWKYSREQRQRLAPIAVPLAAIFTPMATMAAGFIIASSEPVSKTVGLELPPPISKHESDTLIIFIHGWNGDNDKTWEDFPMYASGDPELSHTDVLLISYPTFMLRRNLNIDGVSTFLNKDLKKSGILNKYKKTAIIAHSMGGLVARSIIITREEMREEKQIDFLVEIGTPHQGSDYATIASVLGISSELTGDVTPRSKYLLDLRDHWNKIHKRRPRTYCLSSPQDSVVSTDSAIAYCDYYDQYVEWGHQEMVKPTSRKDERYWWPIDEIKDNLGISKDSKT